MFGEQHDLYKRSQDNNAQKWTSSQILQFRVQ